MEPLGMEPLGLEPLGLEALGLEALGLEALGLEPLKLLGTASVDRLLRKSPICMGLSPVFRGTAGVAECCFLGEEPAVGVGTCLLAARTCVGVCPTLDEGRLMRGAVWTCFLGEGLGVWVYLGEGLGGAWVYLGEGLGAWVYLAEGLGAWVYLGEGLGAWVYLGEGLGARPRLLDEGLGAWARLFGEGLTGAVEEVEAVEEEDEEAGVGVWQ